MKYCILYLNETCQWTLAKQNLVKHNSSVLAFNSVDDAKKYIDECRSNPKHHFNVIHHCVISEYAYGTIQGYGIRY